MIANPAISLDSEETPAPSETMVQDARALMTPSEVVEQRLGDILCGGRASIPNSIARPARLETRFSH